MRQTAKDGCFECVYVFVNGYGVPENVHEDGNYHRYLYAVLEFLDLHEKKEIVLVLAGGCTNREDVSEAEAMHEWFGRNDLPTNVRVELLPHTMTARENLEETYRLLGNVPIHIFCEWSRRRTMQFFAMRLFSTRQIHPIIFDKASMKIGHRAKQLFLHLPFEVLACFLKPIDRLRIRFRERHIATARRLAKQ